MNTRSAREYTVFTPAQFLCNWYEQRPSNQGDFSSTATGKVERVYYTGRSASDLIFVPKYVIVVGSRLKFYTLYFLGVKYVGAN
jgi:hypothetical protein